MLENYRGGLAASCLLATSIVAPLTTKQVKNQKQNLNIDHISSHTPLTTKSANNVNTLSNATNSTIGARTLFNNQNIDDVTINYMVNNNEITIDGPDDGVEINAPNQNLVMEDSINDIPIIAIGINAFSSKQSKTIACASLTFLGHNLRTIYNNAFAGCNGLKSITFDDGLQRICRSSFFNCGLSNVTLPDSLESIDQFAFCDCTNLTEIHTPNDEITGSGITTKTWGSGSTQWITRSIWDENNNLIGRMVEYQLDAYTPAGCLAIGDIDLSSVEMENVGDYAFSNCSNVTSISFPSSVTSIGQAVLGMSEEVSSKLQSITFNWTDPASMACIDNNWLMGEMDYTPVSTFYVPKDSLDEYNAYVADTETCPEWWKTGSVKHFEAIPDPVPPGPTPTDNTLNLGIALGVSLSICIGIPGIIGLCFLGKYKSEEKK